MCLTQSRSTKTIHDNEILSNLYTWPYNLTYFLLSTSEVLNKDVFIGFVYFPLSNSIKIGRGKRRGWLLTPHQPCTLVIGFFNIPLRNPYSHRDGWEGTLLTPPPTLKVCNLFGEGSWCCHGNCTLTGDPVLNEITDTSTFSCFICNTHTTGANFGMNLLTYALRFRSLNLWMVLYWCCQSQWNITKNNFEAFTIKKKVFIHSQFSFLMQDTGQFPCSFHTERMYHQFTIMSLEAAEDIFTRQNIEDCCKKMLVSTSSLMYQWAVDGFQISPFAEKLRLRHLDRP